MSRLARVVAVDCPHHATQRGNYRQQTFFCDDDYRLYLELLTDYSRQYLSITKPLGRIVARGKPGRRKPLAVASTAEAI